MPGFNCPVSPQEVIPQEGRAGVPAYRVRLRTKFSQSQKVTSNTWIDQSVNQKGNELPTLTPPWLKDINLGSFNNVVHLCDEVPHELPE